MNICVAGKNNIAVDVLQYLIDHNNDRYKLWIICNENRGEILGFQKSLSEVAQNNGIPNISLEDVYGLEDLIFLSMEYDRILRPVKFSDARIYNIHFSLLPAYKGMYTSAIPLLNGEQYTGVTFHKIDAGIDTGDIIAQKRIPIEKTDTCRDLYMKYLSNGVELVISQLENVIAGNEESYPQSAEGASYYSKAYINYGDLQLDLNNVAINVQNQVRAYSFREYQMPTFQGTPVIQCEITEEKSYIKPGTVLEEDQTMFRVATVDFVVILYKDRFDEMFKACEDGRLETVKEISMASEHLRIVNNQGWTPLIVATYNNHKDIVEYLISKGADIRVKNYHGTNLLMYAKDAYRNSGDRELFDLYLKHGLSLDDKDDYGKSLRDYIQEQDILELFE